MQLVYSTTSADWASVISRTFIGWVLPLYRDAVGVFYSLSWLVHRTFDRGNLPLCRDVVGVFYSPSWPCQCNIQDTRRGSLTPLLKCIRCILQLQLTEPVSYPGYSSGEPFPFSRDDVGVFYTLSPVGRILLLVIWFKVFYLIKISCKHIYLIKEWDFNRYYYSGSDRRVMSVNGYFRFLKAPEL